MIKTSSLFPRFVCALSLIFTSQVFAECSANDSVMNAYKKRLVVTGFPLLAPQQSLVGGLRDLEVRLPQLIAANINQAAQQIAFDYSHVDLKSLGLGGQLYGDQFYRAGLAIDQLGLPDAQFVLTGMIENMEISSAKDLLWYRRYVSRAAGLFSPKLNRPRRIALNLELIDIYRGELVWQQRFVRHGNWSLKLNEAIGVDDPLFWQTGFGEEIVAALQDATQQIQQTLACQPLMVRVDQVRGDYVQVPTFAARQIQAGDHLRLYKQGNARLNLATGFSEIVKVNADQGEVRLQGASLRDFKAGDLVSLK